jgi:WD40 repeat protein
VVFSPDGRMLASAGHDGTARLWDVRTRKQLRALRGHKGPVYSVVFSPDGRMLASAGRGRTIRLWDEIVWRSFADLKTEVCDLVGSGLSRSEWAQYTAGVPYRRSCP